MIEVSKILLENDSGKFLVVQERESGKWELPGGTIETEEDRFDAARRELNEETGLEVGSFEEVVRVEVEDDQIVNCWILFGETSVEKIELDEEELSDYRWVTAEEFRNMDWHADAGYGLPPMVYLEDYLD